MAKYNVFDVCNYILHSEPMTPKRLQKVLYFCYSFYLAANNKKGAKILNRLFKEHFEAWIHGPVIPKVYAKYADFGMSEICVDEIDDVIEKKDAKFLNYMIESLKQFSTYKLEAISHNQSPWINARGNCNPNDICKNKLSDIDILECFASMVNNG